MSIVQFYTLSQYVFVYLLERQVHTQSKLEITSKVGKTHL